MNALNLRFAALLLFAAVCFGLSGEPAAAAESKKPGRDSVLGRRVPSFVLPDSAGKQVSLADFGDAKIAVVVFMGTECPIGNAYVPHLVDLQKRYRDQGVQVIGVNANLSDTAEDVAQHAKEFNIDFPVLVDKQQLAADLLGAERTPEAFVLDGRRNIRYRGRIDDRIGYDFRRKDAKRADLEEAVKEVLADKKVSVAETETEGCLITRARDLQDKNEITFAKHVAPILHHRCAECHHPGTAAPFSLIDYKDARDWSEMIKEVIVERRMPPWNIDPRYGHFENDLQMPKKEIDTVVAWIDNGSPLGDMQDLPKPPEFAEGWTIGKPDIILKMPEEYTVQATGTVKYQYFVTPTNFEEDVWVQASEARPGNWEVVHHIIAFVRPKGSKSFRNLPAVGGFAPGEEPMVLPEGIGFKVPAGAEIVWQLHYTPTGKVEKDRSEVGLLVCKEPPKRAKKGGGAFNFFRKKEEKIPAGASNHRVVSDVTFAKDVELLSLMPHMHVRGKSFKYTAHYPGNKSKSEILLNVPDYDFNWQHRYRFAKPFYLPAGTKLECVAHYDNSADNPANPDPTKIVGWGDQTWDEMMIGWYSYVDVLDDEEEAVVEEKKEETSDEPAADKEEAKPDEDDSPKLETGRVLKRTYDFKFEEVEKELEYALYVPKKYDGTKRYPLIVALHGLHSNPRQILGYPGFTAHAQEHGYILVAPMGYNTRGWYGSMGKGRSNRSDPENTGELSEMDVMNVLEIARKDLKIDDDRIYLLGHSMGGGGSFHLAMKYPDIWAGVAPIAPAAYGPRDRLKSAKHLPFIVIQGEKDRLVRVQGTRRWIDKMKELEMKHQYIEVEGGDHVRVAFNYFDEIFEFFGSHTRPKREAPESVEATP